MYNLGIAIHGGAGTILRSMMTADQEEKYKNALSAAVNIGYDLLYKGGTSLEAVAAAIVSLEDCTLFNAGKGAVFNAEGKHEMDASIMVGNSLEAGAIAAVANLKNPILLAQKVLSHSDHVLLIGDGARKFGDLHNVEFESDEYFFDQHRFEQWQEIRGTGTFQLDHSHAVRDNLGTVGAVALDQDGNLAAGTSTGGMTNKRFGRVGDSSLIGAGTYANNATCAISCTGSGEYLMRAVTAYDVSCLMEYGGFTLENASNEAIMKRLAQLNGDGGLVGIDRQGNISMPFNCDGMYRASKNSTHTIVKIYK